MVALALVVCLAGVEWHHPAGMITQNTLAEVRAKVDSEDWARKLFESRRNVLRRWVDAPLDDIRKVFPKTRGNVYHNFSCPDDRSRLDYDPFNAAEFRCPTCKKTFKPDTDPGIYKADDPYHGTMYDGWVCLYYQSTGSAAVDLAVVGRLDGNDAYVRRAADIIMLFADTLPLLKKDREGQYGRILTYHREGDNKILDDVATAYELVRDVMTTEERARVERDVLKRLLEEEMLEPIYTYDHNNVYQWHRTILQTALALEREDLIDWSFGYGAFSPENQPEHRSLRRIAATHFKPDGAFWELCSGYHLYPMSAFCEVAILSHNLSTMDPKRFPAEQYDYSSTATEGGRAIDAALEWFLSMSMPDRTVTVIGDSTKPRAGMADYDLTAEVGYRYFDIRAIGDYDALRAGQRSWVGLLYGAPRIVQGYTPYTSSYLSSGWLSLRNEWNGNRFWVGLNGMIPGGGHQHADRLTFTHYSHGKLLALEKATPYNESVTRILGTLSPSHNTVTVGKESSKQGEALKGDEIPEVRYFYGGPSLKYGEVHADKVYGETTAYRRSVAVVEDVALDCFRVVGGSPHDWMVHHAGGPPKLSIPMEPATFEPKDWLTNGTDNVLRGTTADAWNAQWRVDDVNSRVTLLGSGGTTIYQLQTYPLDNAVVTDKTPPCETLCVRREDDAPFVAVWDAWKDAPTVKNIRQAADNAQAVMLTTATHTYRVLFGAGHATFADGTTLSSDGAFALMRDTEAAVLVGGTTFEAGTTAGGLGLHLDAKATVSAERRGRTVTIDTTGDIQYDTVGGRDRYRDAPNVKVTIDGSLWPCG